MARQAADRVPEGREGPFTRQLCWRDFCYHVALAFPGLSTRPYRPGARDEWRYDADTLDAWSQGRTGVPIVDAGMRQLRAEGWMHNRARLITASYLTKQPRLTAGPGSPDRRHVAFDLHIPVTSIFFLHG